MLSQYSCTGYYTCLFGEIGPYRECGPGTVFDSSINNCNFESAVPECGCDVSSPDSYATVNNPPATRLNAPPPTPPPTPAVTEGQGDPYYSVSFVNIWREKRVIRSANQANLEVCGYTTESVKT